MPLRESFSCTKDMGNKKMVGERRTEVVKKTGLWREMVVDR